MLLKTRLVTKSRRSGSAWKVRPTELQKSDWEQLCLALKVYEKLLNVESMEQTGYSGYNRNSYGGYSDARGRDSMGRYVSRDNYSGAYYGNSYDDQVIDDMMRRATPCAVPLRRNVTS